MKKITFTAALVLLFSILAAPVFGQDSAGNFAPINAEWWAYGDVQDDLLSSIFSQIVHSVVVGDTVINGRTCRKIVSEVYGKDVVSEGNEIHTYFSGPTYLRTVCVYSTPDTVFVFNKNFNRFTPLLVFNVHEGDTVCLPVIGSDLRPNPVAGGDTCFCFVIDSIRTVKYDTTYLETYFEHSIIQLYSFDTPSSFSWPVYNWDFPLTTYYTLVPDNDTPHGTYARVIGGEWGGILPHHIRYLGTVVMRPDTVIYNNSGIRCYHDSDYAIQLTSHCYFDTTNLDISHFEINKNSFIIYPNPTKRMIYLESEKPFPKDASVTLFDNSGRKLRTLPAPSGEKSIRYDLKGLSEGVYFLKINMAGKTVVKKVNIVLP